MGVIGLLKCQAYRNISIDHCVAMASISTACGQEGERGGRGGDGHWRWCREER